MNEIVTVKFNGVTAEIKPVKDGMYDLNDIWRTFKLPVTKRPSEWRDDARERLVKSANIRNKRGRYGGAFATKKALFMYAAWCDYEFHDVVVEVFQLVTEGKTDEAIAQVREVVVKREWIRKDYTHNITLTRPENSQVGVVHTNELGHRLNMTLSTKMELCMYTAWCDYEFYDVVVEVFQLVTEGKTDAACS